MLTIVMSNGGLTDISLSDDMSLPLARKIWRYGLKNEQEYDNLKKALPLDHLVLQVASYLDQSNLLMSGTMLNFDSYYSIEAKLPIDINRMVSENQTLFKMIKQADWNNFLRQIEDYNIRPALRIPKDPHATHKLDLRTGEIVNYHINRPRPTPKIYTHTKKQSATLLSKNLNTAIFFTTPTIGLLFDESKCDIRARCTLSSSTYSRWWVGSREHLENRRNSGLTSTLNKKFYTETEHLAFREHIDGNNWNNEVLAKFSRESILGIFFVENDPVNSESNRLLRQEAKKRRDELMQIIYATDQKTIDFPIFIYNPTKCTIRLYTKQEQTRDTEGYYILAVDNIECEQLAQRILNAIKENDINTFMDLFSAESRNKKIFPQKSWITEAIEANQNEMLRYLLTLNWLNKNERDPIFNETHLIHAIRLGARREETVRILLNSYLDINAQDKSGHTALMHTIIQDNERLFECLLTYHPDVDLLDNENETALTLALKNFDYIKVARLLAYTKSENDKKIAILFAIEQCHLDMVQYLISHCEIDVNIFCNNGETPLMAAVRIADTDLLKILLKRNPNFNLRDANGNDVFDIATQMNQQAILTLLNTAKIKTSTNSPLQSLSLFPINHNDKDASSEEEEEYVYGSDDDESLEDLEDNELSPQSKKIRKH